MTLYAAPVLLVALSGAFSAELPSTYSVKAESGGTFEFSNVTLKRFADYKNKNIPQIHATIKNATGQRRVSRKEVWNGNSRGLAP